MRRFVRLAVSVSAVVPSEFESNVCRNTCDSYHGG
jgi:hypothetical protein